MKRVGLIGHPIAHSLSPAIHNAAFAHYGRDERYELWDTEAPALQRRVRRPSRYDFLGANVTVPYKQAVMPFVDRLDPLAEQTGAVNTIVNEARPPGRVQHRRLRLRDRRSSLAGFSPKGQRAVVLGAGGAARAVALVLVRGEAAVDRRLPTSTLSARGRLPSHLRSLVGDDAAIRAHSACRSCLSGRHRELPASGKLYACGHAPQRVRGKVAARGRADSLRRAGVRPRLQSAADAPDDGGAGTRRQGCGRTVDAGLSGGCLVQALDGSGRADRRNDGSSTRSARKGRLT